MRAGKANLAPVIRPVVENALSDRQLLRNLEYVRVLDEEDARFKKAPASFRNSPIGNDVTDALNLARDLAIRNAGTLARERYQRNLDELNEHLRDASKILIDITSAERNKLDQAVVTGTALEGGDEDVRRRQARRRARPLAVQRRVLARRARLLPAGRGLEVREQVRTGRAGTTRPAGPRNSRPRAPTGAAARASKVDDGAGGVRHQFLGDEGRVMESKHSNGRGFGGGVAGALRVAVGAAALLVGGAVCEPGLGRRRLHHEAGEGRDCGVPERQPPAVGWARSREMSFKSAPTGLSLKKGDQQTKPGNPAGLDERRAARRAPRSAWRTKIAPLLVTEIQGLE